MPNLTYYRRFLDLTDDSNACIKAVRSLVRREIRRVERSGERGGRPVAKPDDPLRAKWREDKRRYRSKKRYDTNDTIQEVTPGRGDADEG